MMVVLCIQSFFEFSKFYDEIIQNDFNTPICGLVNILKKYTFFYIDLLNYLLPVYNCYVQAIITNKCLKFEYLNLW